MVDTSREKILLEVESGLGVKLPEAYRSFVMAHTEGDHYLIGGRRWAFKSLAEQASGADSADALTSPRTVAGKPTPFVRILEMFAQNLSELLGVYTSDTDGKPYEVKRLSGGIAVGEADGDIIYLDRFDRFSVWCYYQGGGDVELIAKSFEDLMDSAVLEKPEPETPEEPEAPAPDVFLRLSTRELRIRVRQGIERYLRDFLIPNGDISPGRMYSDAAKGILKEEYDNAIERITQEIMDDVV